MKVLVKIRTCVLWIKYFKHLVCCDGTVTSNNNNNNNVSIICYLLTQKEDWNLFFYCSRSNDTCAFLQNIQIIVISSLIFAFVCSEERKASFLYTMVQIVTCMSFDS